MISKTFFVFNTGACDLFFDQPLVNNQTQFFAHVRRVLLLLREVEKIKLRYVFNLCMIFLRNYFTC